MADCRNDAIYATLFITAASFGYYLSSRSLLAFIPILGAALVTLLIHLEHQRTLAEVRKFGPGKRIYGKFTGIIGVTSPVPGPDDLAVIRFAPRYGFRIIIDCLFTHESKYDPRKDCIQSDRGTLTFQYDTISGTVCIFTNPIGDVKWVQNTTVEEMINIFYRYYTTLSSVYGSFLTAGPCGNIDIPRVVLHENHIYVAREENNMRYLICEVPKVPVRDYYSADIEEKSSMLVITLQDSSQMFISVPLMETNTAYWIMNGISKISKASVLSGEATKVAK